MKKNSNEFMFVIHRKSRIVMKDALVIIKKAKKIKEKEPNATVTLQTSAPVCSKSIKFMKGKGIGVLSINKLKIFSPTIQKGLKFSFNLKGRACNLNE